MSMGVTLMTFDVFGRWYLRQKPVVGSKAGGLPHPSLSLFPPLPLSIPPKFSDKPVGGKVRSSEGKFPSFPLPYKCHRGVWSL